MIAERFQEQMDFVRALIANPRGIGAIAPSSPSLARAMAAEIDPSRPGPVLELGPGTGAITRQIFARGVVPQRFVAVEFQPDFAKRLAARFPGATIVTGDAFDLDVALGGHIAQPLAAVVSGLPLLNYEPAKRARLMASVMRQLAPGASFVLFSYGLNPPVPPPAGASVRLATTVWRNLPPARVWVYRKR